MSKITLSRWMIKFPDLPVEQYYKPVVIGKRLLQRFKTVNGVEYQLHGTKGWRKVGRVM